MSCPALPLLPQPDPLLVEDRHVSETVLALACGVATDHAFDRLPILADALEDAGCDNFTLLSHLRHDAPHDCRALRRLLRTTLTLPGGVPMAFAFCPPGKFTMSSDVRDTAYDERPARRVTLTQGFWAGVVPVTQLQWRAVRGRAAGRHTGDRRPVESVSWDDANTFCRMAARAVGKPLRLPTEAEWEYACRGGTSTEYHWGDSPTGPHMNCAPRAVWGTDPPPPRGQTNDVGTYPPNPWGLFDCHGNVWEWCQDFYVPTFYTVAPAVDPVCHTRGDGQRVIRGGSFAVMANLCRSASRYSAVPTSHSDTIGFRVVFAG